MLNVSFVKFLDSIDIIWEYESKTFRVSNELTYTPDFFLIEHELYLEVKGYFRRPSQLEKFNLFSVNHKIFFNKERAD